MLLVLVQTLLYSIMLITLSVGIRRLSSPTNSYHHKGQNKRGSEPLGYKEQHGISVIVAARNEERSIKKLLDCLYAQSYSPDFFEVIVVSDRSDDSTEQIVLEYMKEMRNLRFMKIPTINQGGKKRALAMGISGAVFEILAFTDADCLPPPNWLNEVNLHFGSEIDFVAGYSPLIVAGSRLLSGLKNIERISMFAVSAGSIGLGYGLTCVARNMAYRKNLFNRVGGFGGLEDTPSGDDDLMLLRMNPHIRKMNFMFTKDSAVPSIEHKDFHGQINLETRRASKWLLYPTPVKVISAFVFIYYLSFLSALILVIIRKQDPLFLVLMIILKSLAEYQLILHFCHKIKSFKYLSFFPIAELIYLPYFVFFALKGTFGTYQWKK